MRKSLVPLLAVLMVPGLALADAKFWRDVLSSGATTAATYVTFKDHKEVVASRDDASSFIASGGEIRGPYLEAALRQMRAENPGVVADDQELALQLLTAQ
jgi:uncharacterized protein (TIGR02448 family)